MNLLPVNKNATPLSFVVSFDLMRQSDFSIIHWSILGEAGASFFSEVHCAPEHSWDEMLLISISPAVFRGKRERRGKDSTQNPRDSVSS